MQRGHRTVEGVLRSYHAGEWDGTEKDAYTYEYTHKQQPAAKVYDFLLKPFIFLSCFCVSFASFSVYLRPESLCAAMISYAVLPSHHIFLSYNDCVPSLSHSFTRSIQFHLSLATRH